ncbi:MAG: hypothetical protein JO048_04825 [Methylobacteriaceae bacterium]|nr:hypothetical protein [Methylobacteriaceae bacterium]
MLDEGVAAGAEADEELAPPAVLSAGDESVGALDAALLPVDSVWASAAPPPASAVDIANTASCFENMHSSSKRARPFSSGFARITGLTACGSSRTKGRYRGELPDPVLDLPPSIRVPPPVVAWPVPDVAAPSRRPGPAAATPDPAGTLELLAVPDEFAPLAAVPVAADPLVPCASPATGGRRTAATVAAARRRDGMRAPERADG